MRQGLHIARPQVLALVGRLMPSCDGVRGPVPSREGARWDVSMIYNSCSMIYNPRSRIYTSCAMIYNPCSVEDKTRLCFLRNLRHFLGELSSLEDREENQVLLLCTGVHRTTVVRILYSPFGMGISVGLEL